MKFPVKLLGVRLAEGEELGAVLTKATLIGALELRVRRLVDKASTTYLAHASQSA